MSRETFLIESEIDAELAEMKKTKYQPIRPRTRNVLEEYGIPIWLQSDWLYIACQVRAWQRVKDEQFKDRLEDLKKLSKEYE